MSLSQIRTFTYVSDLVQRVEGLSRARVPLAGLAIDRLVLVHAPAPSLPAGNAHAARVQEVVRFFAPEEIACVSFGDNLRLDAASLRSLRLRRIVLHHARFSRQMYDNVRELRLKHLTLIARDKLDVDGSGLWVALTQWMRDLKGGYLARTGNPEMVVVVTEEAGADAELRQEHGEAVTFLETRGMLSFRPSTAEDSFEYLRDAVDR